MPQETLLIVTTDTATAAVWQHLLAGDIWQRYAALLPQIPSRAQACTRDDLEAQLGRLDQDGCCQISLLPVGLEVDINDVAVPDSLRLEISPSMFLDTALADLCLRGIEATSPDAYRDYAERIQAPDEIERRSLEFIEGLLADQPFSDGERAVAARIIHAAGDPLLAASLEFHPDALNSALAAIRRGATVYTDVKMLAAGINRRITEQFGCEVVCALDSFAGSEATPNRAVTRSRAAFESLGAALDGALVAIGNAPTALLAVLDLARDGVATPACIIGLPVGFVQARESKERLRQGTVPFITLRGFRGGSGLAAAAVNALRGLAAGDD